VARRNDGGVLLGVLAILVGVVLLLRQVDVIDPDVRIWPLVLLVVGLWLLFDRLVTRRLGAGITWPLVLIAIGGVLFLQDLDVIDDSLSLWPILLIIAGVAIVVGAVMDRRGSSVPATIRRFPLDGATGGRISLRHGAGTLRVRADDLEGGVLLTGSFRGEVDATSRREGDRIVVEVGTNAQGWTRHLSTWSWERGALDWDVAIARGIPIDLTIEGGASKNELDLRELTIGELRLRTGASDSRVTLPASGVVRASVDGGAASVKIDVPDGVALRVRSDSGLADVDVDTRRFPKTGSEYRSSDWDTATDRVDLTVSVGVASVKIR
jgi:hypothetical protein